MPYVNILQVTVDYLLAGWIVQIQKLILHLPKDYYR